MKKIVVAALLGSLFATPALAASVVNGSFETPAVGSVTYGNAGTTNGAGYEPNGGAFGYAAAPDGNQILHLQGTGSGTLSLIDLVVGGKYEISFFGAARPNYPVLSVDVAYNGVSLGTFTPTSTAFTLQRGYIFNATGTTGTLSFTGLNLAPSTSNDQNAGIDLARVAAVPEPATWAMMLLGFGMVGAGLRGRRAGKIATRVAFG